jgi:hypothetical protein
MKGITLGEPISFENLGCGAAVEKFEDAMLKVLANILDPNTRPETAREVILRVKVKPDEDRTSASVIIDCQTKLASDKAYPTKIFIGRNIQGHPEAHEINANQVQLFPKGKDNVAALTAGKEEGHD